MKYYRRNMIERGVMKVARVNYTLRLEEEEKIKAEQIFKTLGMNLATGISVYLKSVIRQEKIPFILEIEKTPAMKFKEAFEKAQKEAVLNGTADMTMDEINAVIADERLKERGI